MVCEICGRPLHQVRPATETELRNPLYLADLRRAMSELGIPRRGWREAIASALSDHYRTISPVELDGEGSEQFDGLDVDESFPQDDDQRWVSEFIREPATGKRYRLTARAIERVRLIDLYFRIRHPELAIRFGRRNANDNAASVEGRRK